MADSSSSHKGAIIGAALGALGVTGAILALQVTWANGIYMAFRSNVGFWGVTIFTTVTAVIAFVHWAHNDSRSYRDSTPSKPVGVFVFLTILGILAGVWTLFFSDYKKAQGYSNITTVVQPENELAAIEDHEIRGPYSIASTAAQDKASVNGEVQHTTYIPSMEHFGTAVNAKGIFTGYGEVVWQKITPNGDAKTDNCTFAEGGKRVDGLLGANLNRAIIRKDFGIIIDSADSYAYCDEEGTPMIVVPLKKYKGIFFPIQVPAGVAIYNGATDDLEIKKNVKTGEVPGPVYPMSLMDAVRDGTNATASWWSYVQSLVGYKVYGGSDTADYNLHKASNDGDTFMTPLTRTGNAKAIVGVGYSSSSEVTYGKLNSHTIAILPESREGDSAVSAKVKSDYRGLEWDTGMDIFEIVPAGAETWTATLGQTKSIMYRLEIKANGDSCLFDTSGKKLRCTGDNQAKGDDTPAVTDGEGDPLNLTAMTDKEFSQLVKQVGEEASRRLSADKE